MFECFVKKKMAEKGDRRYRVWRYTMIIIIILRA